MADTDKAFYTQTKIWTYKLWTTKNLSHRQINRNWVCCHTR